MKMLPLFLFVSCFLFSAQAQLRFQGECPDVSVVQDFDLDRYSGVWYEFAKYPTTFQTGGKCTTATYTANNNGTITVFNRSILKDTNQVRSITGSATPSGQDGEAKLTVSFPSSQFQRSDNYWVLATDYRRYAVVYSCAAVDANNVSKFAWILTRSPYPSWGTLRKAYKALRRNEVDTKLLVKTVQDCWKLKKKCYH